MKMVVQIHKFPECQDCVNEECDPDQCEHCVDGSNYEGEGLSGAEFDSQFTGAGEPDELSYAEFIDLFGRNE